MTTQPAYQQRQSRLLGLPRELRDEIYTYYLQEPGGYVHSPSTNKLRCYDGQIIDFSLVWTCKMVASEMRDLPLRVNEVVFRPFQDVKTSPEGSDIWSAWSQAGKYDFLLGRLHLLQEEMFALAATTHGQSTFVLIPHLPIPNVAYGPAIDTTSATRQISQRHPESCIGDIMARIMKHANKDYVPLAAVMGGPQTMTYYDREVIQGSLMQLTSHAGFAERLRSRGWFIDILGFLTSRPPLSRSTHLVQMEKRSTAWSRVGKEPVFKAEHDVRYAEQLSLMRLEEMRLIVAKINWQPWIVATDEEMSRLRDLFETPCPKAWSSYEDNLASLQYFQSAASQAVRFVDMLQTQSRKQMRKIKILENEKPLDYLWIDMLTSGDAYSHMTTGSSRK
ncbi:hypothetical protein J4E90_009019 [Alternaria incomplexa]|uniref:uncharacterized protein n=1 Tax=Alternaria incomplexa TaxID=1187928 RepID=UPI0022206BFE|nr:uncharacterized protein J4E90_009019 [Alternaria incomplexa]KAI4908394.1 hypothetical protein J4E90_009019 [Alternaria incomplexa]